MTTPDFRLLVMSILWAIIFGLITRSFYDAVCASEGLERAACIHEGRKLNRRAIILHRVIYIVMACIALGPFLWVMGMIFIVSITLPR